MDWNKIGYAAGCVAIAAAIPAWGYQPQPDPAPVVIARSTTSGSYLGVGVAELTQDRVKALNLKEERGVEITRVEDESPASKAGLKTSDVVLEYNGQRVEGLEQFMRLVRETPPGREVKLSISRGGAPQQIAVRTESRKAWTAARAETVEIPRIELPGVRLPDIARANMSWRSTVLGVDAESLDPQLAEFFGVREGVLVRSVVKGSAAERAGLKAGDVIVKVDDTKVATPREVTSAVRSSRSRRSVSLTAIREKREMTFPVPVDDNTDTYHAMPRPAK
jgi:serine protease Do